MTALAFACFADEGSFLRARARILASERRVVGEWLPYAATSLSGDDGAGALLGWTIAGGVLGAAALFGLESWSAILAYPFVEGARPAWSWQAFVPPPIEFGALCAALAGTARLFVNAGLTRLHHPAFGHEEVLRASRDAFVLAIACDAGEDANAALALLAEAGAAHSRLVSA